MFIVRVYFDVFGHQTKQTISGGGGRAWKERDRKRESSQWGKAARDESAHYLQSVYDDWEYVSRQNGEEKSVEEWGRERVEGGCWEEERPHSMR